MEWVYNPPQEEPTFFEGKAHASQLTSRAPFDLFAPAPPVESSDLHSEEEEPEFYGDTDTLDPKIPPEQAFSLFARHVDFSTSIHFVASPSPTSQDETYHQASETRSERFKRLSAELSALANEVGAEDVGPLHSSGLRDLAVLREQLRSIELSVASKTLSLPGTPLLSTRPVDGDGSPTQLAANSSLESAAPAPPVMYMLALERRVAALEASVGISHQSSVCDGKALGPMLEDVHLRLELLSDSSLPDKLKEDAREIAQILQRHVQNERSVEVLRTATVLSKMERWELLADTVPLLVERLRGFKRLQDDATCFADALSALGKQVDMLYQRSGSNATLVANVQRSLEQNIRSVKANLDILQERLEASKQTC